MSRFMEIWELLARLDIVDGLESVEHYEGSFLFGWPLVWFRSLASGVELGITDEEGTTLSASRLSQEELEMALRGLKKDHML